jgi:tetratricopeptide (TPR) repeat protein
MPLDAYSPCPCGSGKKFKWCCQPIHVSIDRAFQKDAEGQHEAALQLLDEVVAEHSGNPEAYGRKAQLLYQNNRVDEAEETIQKALALNPNYPFGYLLRGVFRQGEGELPGALLLFRKAAELYDPEAHDYLGQIYSLIADAELRLNHPIASQAALKIAIRHLTGAENLRQMQDEVFGEKSRLPSVARRAYTFRSPPATVAPARREAWNRALASGAKLSDAAAAFEQLTKEDPEDTAAWYNLGVARAWLGNNHGALEALDQYVGREPDENQAADAWALGEVLRLGHEMEDVADYIEHSVMFQMRDPQALFRVLETWERERRFVPVQVDQERGMITGMVLERKPNLTPELAASQVVGLASYLLIVGGHLRLWHTNAAMLAAVREELQQGAGPGLAPAGSEQGVANFNDLLSDALGFPMQAISEEEAQRKSNEYAARYFEETWIHRPLKSLNQIPPIDAAGHGVLRKKLRGVLQFLQEAAGFTHIAGYDFDRIRRKLGLLEGVPAPAAAQGPDIGGMSAAELAGLAVEGLPNDQLERAYQAAIKLDARELAGRFAEALVARQRTERPLDRYPWYSHLIQQAQGQGDLDRALTFVKQGEQADAEENEGRRRDDYALRRGQLHAKRGEADQARDVFEQLIQRAPSEVRYRGSAAEAMLSAKQGAKALAFAEGGLKTARAKNDRDSEQYFLELVDAAKRMG